MILEQRDQYFRIISEGSRDTEDWSNDCQKIQHFILEINYILKYIQIENNFNLQ